MCLWITTTSCNKPFLLQLNTLFHQILQLSREIWVLGAIFPPLITTSNDVSLNQAIDPDTHQWNCSVKKIQGVNEWMCTTEHTWSYQTLNIFKAAELLANSFADDTFKTNFKPSWQAEPRLGEPRVTRSASLTLPAVARLTAGPD